MQPLPSSDDVTQIPGPHKRYPGFGLSCFTCGHPVEEFIHFRNATVMLHHGQKCVIWKEVSRANNV